MFKHDSLAADRVRFYHSQLLGLVREYGHIYATMVHVPDPEMDAAFDAEVTIGLNSEDYSNAPLALTMRLINYTTGLMMGPYSSSYRITTMSGDWGKTRLIFWVIDDYDDIGATMTRLWGATRAAELSLFGNGGQGDLDSWTMRLMNSFVKDWDKCITRECVMFPSFKCYYRHLSPDLFTASAMYLESLIDSPDKESSKTGASVTVPEREVSDLKRHQTQMLAIISSKSGLTGKEITTAMDRLYKAKYKESYIRGELSVLGQHRIVTNKNGYHITDYGNRVLEANRYLLDSIVDSKGGDQ